MLPKVFILCSLFNLVNGDINLDKVLIVESKVVIQELKKNHMLPRGSVLMTSSGDLQKLGIKTIIHAATGSMTKSKGQFEPTLDSIGHSVTNSLELALKNNFKSIAIPFLGGKIFASRIGGGSSKIMEKIVDSAQSYSSKLEIHFVLFDDPDFIMFKKYIDSKYKNLNFKIHHGSIVDFKLHTCSIIVNAANMEVKFGGGLSGVIAKATNNESKIDLEAKSIINEYYKKQTGK